MRPLICVFLIGTVLSGCGAPDAGLGAIACLQSEQAGLGLDESSSLGFSAADAIAAIPPTASVDVLDADDAAETREFDFEFVADGEVAVVSRDDDASCTAALEGESLRVRGVLSVVSDDWIAAEVPVSLFAQAADSSALWLSGASWEVTGSEALEADALSFGANESACDEDVLTFGLVVGLVGERPLSVGPTGAVLTRFEGCGRGMTARTAAWGDSFEQDMFVDADDVVP